MLRWLLALVVVGRVYAAEPGALYPQHCELCHGAEGRGDGRSAAELKDYAGRPLRPTDFTLGVFKGGADPRQLYLRIATGLNGTPMAEYGDEVLKPGERWALVEYLMSLVGK